MADTLRVKIDFDGIAEMRAAFRRVPNDASRELRAATLELSDLMATRIQSAARSSDDQSAAVAKTVRARKDRVPSVVAGGNTRVTRQRRVSEGQRPTRASDLLFGANFGATKLRQYRAHTGAGEDDYWFFVTIEQHRRTINGAWLGVLEEVLDRWGESIRG